MIFIKIKLIVLGQFVGGIMGQFFIHLFISQIHLISAENSGEELKIENKNLLKNK